jgi:hypothetical protein
MYLANAIEKYATNKLFMNYVLSMPYVYIELE